MNPETQLTNPAIGADATAIKFGAYNNNNKVRKQHDTWNQAWYDFSEQQYVEGLKKVFYYLLDEKEGNLTYEINDGQLNFRMYQGSAKLEGSFDGTHLHAKAVITKLDKASPMVMRKLLDQNQALLYSRIALDADILIVIMMNFSTALLTPHILYSGLRELLVMADRLDDGLVRDFGQAVSIADPTLKSPIPDAEATIKYQYAKQWTTETLAYLKATNRADLQAIATYLPLTLVCRMNYLCSVKGAVEEKLAEIANTYWENMQSKKLNLGAILQKQTQLIEALGLIPESTFRESLYRTRDSFSSKGPIEQKEIESIILHTIDDVRDAYNHGFTEHAFYALEYTLGNLVNDFNLPYLFVELYHLQMQVLHSDFFEALGFKPAVYVEGTDTLNAEAINACIHDVIDRNRELFPRISFDFSCLEFTDAYQLCLGISTAAAKMVLTLS